MLKVSRAEHTFYVKPVVPVCCREPFNPATHVEMFMKKFVEIFKSYTIFCYRTFGGRTFAMWLVPTKPNFMTITKIEPRNV